MYQHIGTNVITYLQRFIDVIECLHDLRWYVHNILQYIVVQMYELFRFGEMKFIQFIFECWHVDTKRFSILFAIQRMRKTYVHLIPKNKHLVHSHVSQCIGHCVDMYSSIHSLQIAWLHLNTNIDCFGLNVWRHIRHSVLNVFDSFFHILLNLLINFQI